MRFIGMDLGKANIEVAIQDPTGQLVQQTRITNNPSGWAELETLLQPSDRIGIEAGTLAFPVHDHFQQQGYDIRVGDPKRMKIIWECDHKFDGKDAREIANLLRADMFPRIHVPTPTRVQERELVRIRFDAVAEGIRVKNRIHALLDRAGLKPPFKGKSLFQEQGLQWLSENHFTDHRNLMLSIWVDELRAVQQRVERLDTSVARIAASYDVTRNLLTIPGIATLWAAVVVVEVQDMHRFPSVEHFSSYAGSAPRNYESAGKNRGRGVVKRSNKRLKMALGMAAEAASKTAHDNPVKACLRKQLRRGKRGKAALAPCRGVMARTVYAVWKKDEPCTWSNPARTKIKLNQLTRLASGRGGA